MCSWPLVFDSIASAVLRSKATTGGIACSSPTMASLVRANAAAASSSAGWPKVARCKLYSFEQKPGEVGMGSVAIKRRQTWRAMVGLFRDRARAVGRTAPRAMLGFDTPYVTYPLV